MKYNRGGTHTQKAKKKCHGLGMLGILFKVNSMILKATTELGSLEVRIASTHPSAERGSLQASFMHILARMQQAT